MQLAPLAILLSSLAACQQVTPAEDPQPLPPSRTEVFVMGMIHSGHRTSELWGLDEVRETIRAIQPDVICTEIPPANWASTLATWKQRKVVEDRRANPRDDLISILCHSDLDGDKLATEEILQEALLILIGGDETTRHVMTGGLEQLLLNPGEKQKLIDDPTRIEVAVEEMIRWVSPIVNTQPFRP